MADNKLICLITGANRGLGYEAAKALLQTKGPNGTPYHVLIGCRDLAKGEAAVKELQTIQGITGSVSALALEVASEESVAKAAAQVKSEFGRLDALVNNAGVVGAAPSVLERLHIALDTNVIGAAMVTEAFLPLLLAAPAGRLVFVGSSMGSLTGSADVKSRYYKSVMGTSPLEYRVSKAALNMMMLEYWKKYGVHEGGTLRVWTADPGPNATDFMGPGAGEMAKQKGLQTADVGAKQLVACVLGERDGEEGKMWGAYGVSPW
ncbi:putative short chain dehydrogenase/reductase [Mycena vitilis]|nr:putative short chain dehydrogenase/reductase [Mycena vitilis]